MSHENEVNANILSQAAFREIGYLDSVECEAAHKQFVGGLVGAAYRNRKRLREQLQDRIDAQAIIVTTEQKKEAAMLELAKLIDENPHIARIMELIEENGL